MNVKKCRVCGDQATGFNYDGLSCESCKVFFCRNSAKTMILKCEFTNNCLISIGTRKKCPKCRLIKCLSIGMKRKSSNPSKNGPLNSQEDKTQNGIDPLLEISILKCLSDFDLKSVTNYVSNQMVSQKKRLALDLNSFELDRIAEAQNAIGTVFRDERTVPIVKYIDTYDETLTDPTEMYIIKSINFCQHFAAFNSLENEDQLVLLKPFILDLLGLWFCFKWDTKNNGNLMFTDQSQTGTYFIPNEVGLKYSKNKRELMKTIIDCGYVLHDAMEDDCVIRDLLCAAQLFKHTENLTSPENIRYHHHLYSMLLLRYLQHKCQSKKEGNRKYLKLMRLIGQMESFSKYKREFALNFGVEKLSPIIRELHDVA